MQTNKYTEHLTGNEFDGMEIGEGRSITIDAWELRVVRVTAGYRVRRFYEGAEMHSTEYLDEIALHVEIATQIDGIVVAAEDIAKRKARRKAKGN